MRSHLVSENGAHKFSETIKHHVIALPCPVTGSARRCIKVGGVFYTCGESEEMRSTLASAGKTFHHKRETATDTVVHLLPLYFLISFRATVGLMFPL